MEVLLNRYRNLTVLLLVLVGQLLLLAYQVKSRQDVRLIRVWAVTGVMPIARVLESVRSNTLGFFRDYSQLLGATEENKRLKKEIGALKMENQFLKTELATADRASALAAFQARSPSRTVAARIIGTGAGGASKVVFLDRGTQSGVAKGNAVITEDGIVGKVIATYPSASLVVLITDPGFSAGVISQKGRVHGTLKGQGHSICVVDFIQNEEKVAEGEWFYTSGDDRIFPKGLPVGQVKIARAGRLFKEVHLVPSGFQQGLEEVLVVVDGVHQPIPDVVETSQALHLLPEPPAEPDEHGEIPAGRTGLQTDADQLLQKYRRLGESNNYRYGDNPALAPKPASVPNAAPNPPGGAALNGGAPNAARAGATPSGAIRQSAANGTPGNAAQGNGAPVTVPNNGAANTVRVTPTVVIPRAAAANSPAPNNSAPRIEGSAGAPPAGAPKQR
jgi:rod shape-determining protein MreC